MTHASDPVSEHQQPAAGTAAVVVPVGALHCQRHPYARTLTTTIVSCTPHPTNTTLMLVTTADTVLFPEGGGQPADRGTLQVLPELALDVVDVQRSGTSPVHSVRVPAADDNTPAAAAARLLLPGTRVQLDVDWPRRWDAMQQHSGQHLLSAVAERLFGWRTASWAFGAPQAAAGGTGWSSVEFAPDLTPDAVPVTLERVQALEDQVAAYIEQALPVTVTTDDAAAVPATRTSAKALPQDLADHSAVPIRTVHIGSADHLVDANPCCGTHVTSTAHLGTVLLRPALERVRGTNTRVYFCFGSSRTRALAGAALAREVHLGGVLSCGAREFADKVAKLVDAGKTDRKRIKSLVDGLAGALVRGLGSRAWYHAEGDEGAVDMDVLLAMGSVLKQQQQQQQPADKVYALSGVFGDTLGVVLVGPVGGDMNDKVAQVTAAVPGMRGGGGKGKPGSMAVWQGRLAPVTKEAVDKVKAVFE